jgi:MYXO-CTERM domain-containing protein
MLGRSNCAAWGAFIAAVSLSSVASAVTNPSTGGVTIPTIADVTACADKNVQACLDLAEGGAPKQIDAQKDALIAPETFQPTCQLTFTPIVKGGSIYDVFGWYNVKEDPLNPGQFIKPTQAELYGMFVTNDFKTPMQLANTSVVLDLGVEAAAGRYKGGQIGFFVVSTSEQLSIDPTTHAVIGNIRFQFYTQHALNPGSMPDKTFYNVLTWESVAHKNTFYFGWEDLPVDGGSDNDFDDFLFSVSGVQCGGGGQPCQTGQMGVCAAGVLQCKKSVITCVPTLQASDEKCNALDDDCNGSVDDGDNLCPEGDICSHGSCVPKCGTGEFRCQDGASCTPEGLCVDPACIGMECPEGKVCAGGECVDACTGITCPYGRVCRNGGCVDPCVGIECDAGFACVMGVCSSCECSACGDGTSCQPSVADATIKLCTDTGCEGKTCNAGTHCKAGDCVDDCDGAACPTGQMCMNGECVGDPNAMSTGGSGNGTGGSDVVVITGGTLNGSGASDASGGTTNASGHPLGVTTDQKACNCTVPGAPGSRAAALGLLALLGLARRRRRTAA